MQIEIDAVTAGKLQRMARPGEGLSETLARVVRRDRAAKVTNTDTKKAIQLENAMTYGQVARIFGVAPRTVKRWVARYELSAGKEGMGPVFRERSQVVRIPAATVETFAAGRLGY